ncbi:MAG: hypothetical protein EOP06_02725 [Proteobacteria bacterium]|nr:MAG: hypothetical protein EOP06_02725 [Pseudomonadota bacterium]
MNYNQKLKLIEVSDFAIRNAYSHRLYGEIASRIEMVGIEALKPESYFNFPVEADKFERLRHSLGVCLGILKGGEEKWLVTFIPSHRLFHEDCLESLNQ